MSLRQKESSVEVQVQDNGSGIPEHDLPGIFERFYREAPSYTADQGTGLGLAICRAIATAHGGAVSARNSEQGGAVFTVHLPLGASGTPHELA